MKPPEGYRLLRRGELTEPGDLGCIDVKRGWTELRAGHVIYQRVSVSGRVARKIENKTKKGQ
jgi:hypothetical protein